MSSGGNAIYGDPAKNQVAQTMRSFTSPAAVDLTAGSNGPLGWPARGFIVFDVGAGTLVVDTYKEAAVSIDVTNLRGVYIPCAIKRLVSGANVKVLVFW